MRLQATGILTKLKYDVMDPPFAKPYPKVRVNEPLSLPQLATAFIALAMGLSVALIAFLGELCGAKMRARLSQDEVIDL